MRMPVVLSLAVLVLALGPACRQESAPPPPIPRPSEEGLAPLTSRDGAPSAPATAPGGSLPAGHPPITSDGPIPPGAVKVDPGASVSGTVDVATALKSRITGGALFLIARNPARQIVAVHKADGVGLPQKFQLSAADAMTPGTPFEGPLEITARWSQHGDAMPAAGDIEGLVKGVAVGTSGVKLVLSDVRK